MTAEKEIIHNAVRERYGSIARRSSSCCGPASGHVEAETTQPIYEASTLEGLTKEVTELSLGCGDPVTIAAIQPGETVLDLGSGGGIDCFLAAQRVGPGGSVIGVDMTEEMIALANANKAKMGVKNVEFRLGQIELLPVDDESVDLIISNCVINLSPEKDAVFAEAFRVLKPGGRLSVSDIVTEGEFAPSLQEDMDQWAACVVGAIELGEYLSLLEDAGFADIDVSSKVSADDMVERRAGMPALFSARITARKPEAAGKSTDGQVRS
ncbi:MAG: arsenite methyltransferase [Anaerolineales bacterium]|jgi:SAM-dependent methyltransferase